MICRKFSIRNARNFYTERYAKRFIFEKGLWRTVREKHSVTWAIQKKSIERYVNRTTLQIVDGELRIVSKYRKCWQSGTKRIMSVHFWNSSPASTQVTLAPRIEKAAGVKFVSPKQHFMPLNNVNRALVKRRCC